VFITNARTGCAGRDDKQAPVSLLPGRMSRSTKTEALGI
jgi:hypothetical protein